MQYFVLNGKQIEINEQNENKRLLDFLRDDLSITSVKDGCSAGACGTCSLIIDDKLVRSCLFSLKKIIGKSVLTIEGLTDREKEVFDYAFQKAGAVQCGYCIPGMVLASKALFINNLDPTILDVKKAIKGNICRCTGYVKIEEAILLSAKMLRENLPIPKTSQSGKIDTELFRLDAKEKTLGTGLYADDLKLPEMLFGKALRVKYPRCTILSIDISKALLHKDVVKIVLKEDIPGSSKIGHLVKDWDVLLGVSDTSHYLGDSVALVCATKKESLDEILALIEVEYKELTPISSIEDARDGKNGIVHAHMDTNLLKREELLRGTPDEIIENAKYVVTKTYETPFTEHAFMEVETAIATPEDDGVLIYSGGQSVYDEQHEIAHMLGLPNEKIHVKSMLVGGGFGGKEDMSVQHHAALLAYLVKKPVKVTLSRDESILIHPKRHKMTITLTTACDENGYLKAMKALIYSDAGAYASLSGPVLQRACTHAAGPYNYQNISIVGETYYTNNPPGGAFRGFGVSQSAFAMEANLNLLAEMVGIDEFEIRYRNAVRVNDELPNGQLADGSTALVECLDEVKDIYYDSVKKYKYVGIASALKNSGIGVGIPDVGRCIISIENGKAHVRSSAACIGQGMQTVSMHMVCTETGLSPENVIVEVPDTKRTPDSGTTTASRQTVFTGEAVRNAASKLKIDLENSTLQELEGKEYYGEFSSVTDKMGSDKKNPVSHVAYGYGVQIVILDEEGYVIEVICSYDVGQVVNRLSVEGQLEGGVVMGLGYALTEDYVLENSVPKSKYATLGLFRATQAPKIRCIIVDVPYKGDIAYGSKGVGELATIPTAPAVQNAYYKFDKTFRTVLPLKGTKYKK